MLQAEGKSLLLADEGGFAPGYETVSAALELLVKAIAATGLRPGTDVSIGMDVAATQLLSDGAYDLRREGRTLSSSEMVDQVSHIRHVPFANASTTCRGIGS